MSTKLVPPTVAGGSAVLPGAVRQLGSLWAMCASNRDVVSEVPAARWDVDAAAQLTGMDKQPHEVGLRTRHGGFLRDAELFDNAFFRISPAEAAVMDPQQRLLLEHGYAALHGAGRRKPGLLGSATSVYVGVWASEYTEVLRHSATRSVFASTASSCSVMAGCCSPPARSGRWLSLIHI